MSKSESTMLKGIGLLLMLYHHLYYKLDRFDDFGFYSLIFSNNRVNWFALNFKVCVFIFVFATGYGMVLVEKRYRKGKTAAELSAFKTELKRQYKKALSRYWDLVKTLIFLMVVALIITYALGSSKNLSSVFGNPKAIGIGIFTNMTGIADIFKLFTNTNHLGLVWYNSSWWYATLAAAYIFTFPVLYYVLRKTKPWLMCFAVVLIDVALVMKGVKLPTFIEHLPALTFGMATAEMGVFEQLAAWMKGHPLRRTGLIAGSVAAYVILAILKNGNDWNFILLALMTVAMAILLKAGFSKVPVLNKFLEIIGKNSRYMWLLHTFIYSHWFKQQLFSLKNVGLIYVAEVLATFMLAWVLKFVFDLGDKSIKKLIHR